MLDKISCSCHSQNGQNHLLPLVFLLVAVLWVEVKDILSLESINGKPIPVLQILLYFFFLFRHNFYFCSA